MITLIFNIKGVPKPRGYVYLVEPALRSRCLALLRGTAPVAHGELQEGAGEGGGDACGEVDKPRETKTAANGAETKKQGGDLLIDLFGEAGGPPPAPVTSGGNEGVGESVGAVKVRADSAGKAAASGAALSADLIDLQGDLPGTSSGSGGHGERGAAGVTTSIAADGGGDDDWGDFAGAPAADTGMDWLGDESDGAAALTGMSATVSVHAGAGGDGGAGKPQTDLLGDFLSSAVGGGAGGEGGELHLAGDVSSTPSAPAARQAAESGVVALEDEVHMWCIAGWQGGWV